MKDVDVLYSQELAQRNFTASANYNDGKELSSLNEHEIAIKLYNIAIELEPDYVEAIYERGFSKLMLNRFNEAIKDFNIVLEYEPNHARTLFYLGLARNKVIGLADAEKIQLHTHRDTDEIDTVDTIYSQALALGSKGLHKEAVPKLNKVIQLKPDHINALFFRGFGKYILADYEGAIEDYNKVIELEQRQTAFNKRGIAKFFLGDYKGAEIDCKQALSLNPNDIYANTYIGYVFLIQRDTLEAAKMFAKALKFQEGFSLALQGKAFTLIIQGNKSLAKEIFKKVSQNYAGEKSSLIFEEVECYIIKAITAEALKLPWVYKEAIGKALVKPDFRSLIRLQVQSALEDGISQKKDISEIEFQLKAANEFINQKFQKGETLISLAVEYSHLNVVKFLVSKGVNLELRDAEGNTPLILAYKKSKKDIVKLLLDKEAGINLQDIDGNTPLFLAAGQDDVFMVELLLAHGANVLIDTKGIFPLQIAGPKAQIVIFEIMKSLVIKSIEEADVQKLHSLLNQFSSKENLNSLFQIIAENQDVEMGRYFLDKQTNLEEDGLPIISRPRKHWPIEDAKRFYALMLQQLTSINSFYSDIQLEQALVLYKEETTRKDAETLFKQVLDNKPELKGRLYLERGLIEYELKNYKEAVKNYDTALQEETLDPDLRFKLYEQKLDALSELGHIPGHEEVNVIFNHAMSELKSNRFAQAAKGFDIVLKHEPKRAAAIIYRGLAKDKLRDSPSFLSLHKEAIQKLDKAIKLRPHDANAFFSRGLGNYLLGRYETAIEDYNKSIQLEPKQITFSNRGIAKFFLGDYEGAKTDYEQALSLNPIDAYANTYIGYVFLIQKRTLEAEKMFAKALEIQEDFPLALQGKALTSIVQGKKSLAEENFRKAYRFYTKNISKSVFEHAECYTFKAETAAALNLPDLYKKALEEASVKPDFGPLIRRQVQSALEDGISQRKDIREIEFQLKAANKFINQKFQKGESLISLAVEYGNLNVVKFLALKGVYLKPIDAEGNTPLISAYKKGRKDIVEFLLSKQAGLNVQNNYDGNTLFFLAAEQDDVLMVRLLLNLGANFLINNKEGIFPLQIAGPNSKVVILDKVKSLVIRSIKKANVQKLHSLLNQFSNDKNLNSLLEIVAENQDVEMGRYFLDNQTNLEEGGLRIISRPRKKNWPIEDANRFYNLLLQLIPPNNKYYSDIQLEQALVLFREETTKIEAEALFKKVLDSKPELKGRLYLERGLIEYELRNYEEAVKNYDIADQEETRDSALRLKLYEQKVDALIELGHIYGRDVNMMAAEKYYNQALTLCINICQQDPFNTKAERNINLLVDYSNAIKLNATASFKGKAALESSIICRVTYTASNLINKFCGYLTPQRNTNTNDQPVEAVSTAYNEVEKEIAKERDQLNHLSEGGFSLEFVEGSLEDFEEELEEIDLQAPNALSELQQLLENIKYLRGQAVDIVLDLSSPNISNNTFLPDSNRTIFTSRLNVNANVNSLGNSTNLELLNNSTFKLGR